MSVHGHSSMSQSRTAIILFLDLNEWIIDDEWPAHASIINFPETWSFTQVMSIPSVIRKDIMYESVFVTVREKVGGFRR